MRNALLLVLSLVMPFGDARADGPSFDCAKAEGAAQTLVCQDAALAADDRRLAQRYAEALEVLKGVVDGEPTAAELKAMQRGWIKGRDECWKAGDLRACVVDAYLRREGELVALYMLEQPASLTFWTCGGNAANEIAVYTYETPRPAVRLEYGDTVEAGVLVPAASGAKYEASFGKSFWMKGEKALLEWLQGTTTRCVRRDGGQ